MNNNPWMQPHIDAELRSTGGGYTRRMAIAAVRREYQGAPDPMPCECGGQAHYRATVGARMCPDCRALYHHNGKRVGA